MGGQYLNDANVCTNCDAGSYSGGGTATSCTSCPIGTTVEAGKGVTSDDCLGMSKSNLILSAFNKSLVSRPRDQIS